MSGICGIVNFDDGPVDPDVLWKMAEAAAHRGPDGIHCWIGGNVGFTHLALNITPESLQEQQPLCNADGLICLTADARVDNRDELIHTLAANGHLQVKYPTDAELILAAYRRWGETCPRYIIGDFAFAIWDVMRQHLFAARDAMGARTLYYRVEPGRSLFATEVKQILAAPSVPARIFEPRVAAHLAGHAGLPDWTFYEGIHQLPPAHALQVDVVGSRIWRYWDIDPGYRIEYSEQTQYAEHLLEILEEAVRCRLRSVKPVGLYLSGGIDSGSVGSVAGWLLRQDTFSDHPGIRAYCWAFDELTECDERLISDRIVEHYKWPVTYIPADEAWPLRNYPDHGPDLDEPFIGHYQVLHEQTLATARVEGIGQVFDGRSGDIMLAGNVVDYVDQLRARKLRTLWRDLRFHSERAGVPLHQVIGTYLLIPLLADLWPPGKGDWLRQPLRHALRRPQAHPEWIHPRFAARVELMQIIRRNLLQQKVAGIARQRRYEGIFNPLESCITGWLERLFARFGLGRADPWGDRRMASFVVAIPQQRIIRRPGEYKSLCKQSMRGIMPEEARRTVRKIVPTPFYDRAIREQASETVLGLITRSEVASRGYVDEEALCSHYEAMRCGKSEDNGFWYALTLEMWLRRYWR